MHTAIPLDKMDVTEKLRALEEIWDREHGEGNMVTG